MERSNVYIILKTCRLFYFVVRLDELLQKNIFLA